MAFVSYFGRVYQPCKKIIITTNVQSEFRQFLHQQIVPASLYKKRNILPITNVVTNIDQQKRTYIVNSTSSKFNYKNNGCFCHQFRQQPIYNTQLISFGITNEKKQYRDDSETTAGADRNDCKKKQYETATTTTRTTKIPKKSNQDQEEWNTTTNTTNTNTNKMKLDKEIPLNLNGKSSTNLDDLLPPKNLGIIARFKEMYKRYWYVLVPVHVATSTGWMLGFYYLSKSGVDIPDLLRAISISESVIVNLKDSSMGHLAIAYVCYKVVTPLRYMVTIGGTTFSIRYLSQRGYIKPVPTQQELRQMYDDKKAEIKTSYEDKKAEIKTSYEDKKAEMKTSYEDKVTQMKTSYDDKKAQIKQNIENLTSLSASSSETTTKSSTESSPESKPESSSLESSEKSSEQSSKQSPSTSSPIKPNKTNK